MSGHQEQRIYVVGRQTSAHLTPSEAWAELQNHRDEDAEIVTYVLKDGTLVWKERICRYHDDEAEEFYQTVVLEFEKKQQQEIIAAAQKKLEQIQKELDKK